MLENMRDVKRSLETVKEALGTGLRDQNVYSTIAEDYAHGDDSSSDAEEIPDEVPDEVPDEEMASQ
jgi:hypothetical protein